MKKIKKTVMTLILLNSAVSLPTFALLLIDNLAIDYGSWKMLHVVVTNLLGTTALVYIVKELWRKKDNENTSKTNIESVYYRPENISPRN